MREAGTASKNADVVAVVLHYHEACRTARCLESLIHEGITQIVVVDNSADRGVSWRQVLDRLPAKYHSHLEVQAPPANLGFAAGVNLGISSVSPSGTHLLLFNSDAEAEAGMVGSMLSTLDAAPACKLVGARQRSPSGQVHSPARFFHPWLGLHFSFFVPGSVQYLSGCALLVRGDVATGSKLLDPEFFFYGEDVELSWRIQRGGGAILTAPSAYCRHEGAGSSRRYSHFYELHLIRGIRLLAHRLIGNDYARLFSSVPRELLLSIRAIVHCVRAKTLEPIRAYLGIPSRTS